jgi:hypothetical protein
MISDGAGGYFITWMKNIQGLYGGEIYAQRIGPGGTKLWADTGVVICNAPLNQYWPKIVTDGSGGAIIVWQDNRLGFSNFDIYAQRVDANGARLWTANGVPVLDNFMHELGPEIVSDGNGGVIVTSWRDFVGGADADIYAQRLNGSGAKMWIPTGVVISTAPNRQDVPKIASDGSGGAVISWWDYRNNSTVPDIYAQRINGNGNVVWAANGISVCTMPYDQIEVQVVSDNNNGTYLVWTDFRNSTVTTVAQDIYAQHLNSAGTALWTVNGISVCSANNYQVVPSLVTDESGGVIIGWYDYRGGSSVFAQRLTSGGAALWATDGVSVCATTNNYSAPFLTTDGNNGVFVVWEDKRTGTDKNIYAQHLNSAGSALWTTNGIPICNAPNDQIIGVPSGIVTNGVVLKDGIGRAVVAWQDGRGNTPTDSYDDIYISRISDAPVSLPVMLNVNNKCSVAPTAKGKLVNPPASADITITLDGSSINYFPADSSFEYFIAGLTTPGNHTVRVKYSNFAGLVQKDSVYTVTAAVTPSITIIGNTTVNQGQTTSLTASFSNGGSFPAFQWQDSVGAPGWINIAGATSSTIVYTPSQTGNKIRCILTSNASCITQISATSNALVFTVNTVTAINPVPSNQYGIRYYPNPVREFINLDSLKLSDKWSSLDVFSLDGQKIGLSKNITGLKAVSINIEQLPAAGYIIVLRRKQGSPTFLKFIKQ